MATKTLNARVQNKRDTSTNWTTNDPVLLDGEIILVDTAGGELRFKVGDGTKTYTQLPFTDEPLRALIAAATSTSGAKIYVRSWVADRYEIYDYLYTTNTANTTTATPYVNTGLIEKFNTYNAEWKASVHNNGYGADPMFGWNESDTSALSNFLWFARGNNGGVSTFCLGATVQMTDIPSNQVLTYNYTFDSAGSTLACNGSTYPITAVDESSVSLSSRALILAGGTNTSSGTPYGWRTNSVELGYIKFSDPSTNELLYDFEPAVDTDTGEIGFYETVHGVFYAQTVSNNARRLAVGMWE